MARQGERPLLINGELLRRGDIDRPRQGGGDPFTPFTEVETRARLEPAFQRLWESVASIPPAYRQDRVVFEATVFPNYLAASNLPTELLTYVGAGRLGTKYGTALYRTAKGERPETPTKTLILSADEAGLERLTSLFTATPSKTSARAREELGRIAEVHLQSPAEVLSDDDTTSQEPGTAYVTTPSGLVVWEAVLHPDLRYSGLARPASRDTVDAWIAVVESLGGTVDREWVREAGPLTHMPVSLPPGMAAEAARFNPLRSLRHMPMLRYPRDARLGSIAALPKAPPPPSPAGRALKVAVFDCGVDDTSPYFADRVRSVEVTSSPTPPSAQDHGTLVTSAVLYGDAPGPLEPAAVQVDHYHVVPDTTQSPGTELYWLLDRIREIVADGRYDVVNLSLGPETSVADDIVDPWTYHLDELSYEHGVLFVVAAGNNGEKDAATGLNRVQIPSDLVNGLSVGACDAPAGRTRRASYSALGPGRAGARVAPSGVIFGGTPSNPFSGVGARGELLQHHGTSYAAPFVVHSLADLAEGLESLTLTPELLRACATHFADPAPRSLTTELGHGRFLSDYAAVLDCAPNEVRVLYRGSIARDEYLAFTLPLPAQVTASPVALHYTLAATSPVDSSDPVEYVQACLEPTLRPHAGIYRFTAPAPRKDGIVVDTSANPDEATRLLGAGWTPSQAPVSFSKARRAETVLRTEGKWETLRDFRHRFTRPGALFRPRLDISHLSRESGSLSYNTPPLDFALVVSITAPKDVNLYDAVRSEFRVLAPVTAVSARATVGVRAASGPTP